MTRASEEMTNLMNYKALFISLMLDHLQEALYMALLRNISMQTQYRSVNKLPESVIQTLEV
jgi:uncharacterized protein (DUF305 family)